MKRRRARNRSIPSDEDSTKRATSQETRARKSKRDASTTTPARPSRSQPSEPLHMTTRARAATNSANTSVVSGDSRRSSLAQFSPQGHPSSHDVNEERPRKRRRASTNIDGLTDEAANYSNRPKAEETEASEMSQPTSDRWGLTKPEKQASAEVELRGEPQVKMEEGEEEGDEGEEEDGEIEEDEESGDEELDEGDEGDEDDEDDEEDDDYNDAAPKGLGSDERRTRPRRGRPQETSEIFFDQVDEMADARPPEMPTHSPESFEESKKRRRSLDSPKESKITAETNGFISRQEAETPEESMDSFPPNRRRATEINRSPEDRSISSTNSSPATTPVLGPMDDELALDDELSMPLAGDESAKTSKRLPGRRRAPHADPAVEADLRRQLQLRMAYRSVAKALKPVLAELADRSINSVETNHESHKDSDQFDVVMDDIDSRLRRRLAQLERRYQLESEYYQQKKNAEEALLNQMFSDDINNLKEDYMVRCYYQLLEVYRQMEEQDDSDLTEDEDGIIPRRQGIKYPFARTGPLSSQYDSRSRMFIETENLVAQAVTRYVSGQSRKGFVQQNADEFEDSVGGLAAAFGALNKDQREFATAVLNTSRLLEASEELERMAIRAKQAVIPNDQATALQLLASASMDEAAVPAPSVQGLEQAQTKMPSEQTKETMWSMPGEPLSSPRHASSRMPPIIPVNERFIEYSPKGYSKIASKSVDQNSFNADNSIFSHPERPPIIWDSKPRTPPAGRQRAPGEFHPTVSAGMPPESTSEVALKVEASRSPAERSPGRRLDERQSSVNTTPKPSTTRIMDILNEEQPNNKFPPMPHMTLTGSSSAQEVEPSRKIDGNNVNQEMYNGVAGPTGQTARHVGDDTAPFNRSQPASENQPDYGIGKAAAPSNQAASGTQPLRTASITPTNSDTMPGKMKPTSNFWSTVASPEEHPPSRDANFAQSPIDRVRIIMRQISGISTEPSTARRSSGSLSAISPSSAHKAASQTPPARHARQVSGSSQAAEPSGNSNAVPGTGKLQSGSAGPSSFQLTFPSRRDGATSESPRMQYTMPPLSSLTQGTPPPGPSWAPPMGYNPASTAMPAAPTTTGESSVAQAPPVDPAIINHSGQPSPYQSYAHPPYGPNYAQSSYHNQYPAPYHPPPSHYGSSYPGHYSSYGQPPQYRPPGPTQQGPMGHSRASAPSSQAPSPVSELGTPPNIPGASRRGSQTMQQRSSSVSTSRPSTSQATRPSPAVPHGYNGTQFGKQLLPATPDPRNPQPAAQPVPGPTQQPHQQSQPQLPPQPQSLPQQQQQQQHQLQPQSQQHQSAKPLGPIMVEKELPKKRHRQYSHVPGTVFRGYTGPKSSR